MTGLPKFSCMPHPAPNASRVAQLQITSNSQNVICCIHSASHVRSRPSLTAAPRHGTACYDSVQDHEPYLLGKYS
jgi:hypothetical protein